MIKLREKFQMTNHNAERRANDAAHQILMVLVVLVIVGILAFFEPIIAAIIGVLVASGVLAFGSFFIIKFVVYKHIMKSKGLA